jgi:Domain of unknown function (DUF4326)
MNEKPKRIQRRRAKGSKLPPNTVIVDRSTKWGNPFVVNHPGSALQKPMPPQLAVASFKAMLEKEGSWTPIPLPWPKGKIPRQWTTVEEAKEELRGYNLACWCRLCDVHKDGKPLGVECKDCEPCHADILLELSNPQPIEAGEV